MTLLLVRHAVALGRRKWDGPDELRPLSGRGARQADALVDLLAAYEVGRVLSSPTTRCVDTMAPLARVRGLEVEGSDDLAEGNEHAAVRLVGALASDDAALCSHGDVIPFVLDDVARSNGVDLGPDPRSAKGSTWVLAGAGGRFTVATYLAPPA